VYERVDRRITSHCIFCLTPAQAHSRSRRAAPRSFAFAGLGAMPPKKALAPMQAGDRTVVWGGYIAKGAPVVADARKVDQARFIRVAKREKWLCKAACNQALTTSPLKGTEMFKEMRNALQAARDDNEGMDVVEDDRMEAFHAKISNKKALKKKKKLAGKGRKRMTPRLRVHKQGSRTRVVQVEVPRTPGNRQDTVKVSLLAEASPGREAPLWLHEKDIDWLVAFLRMEAGCAPTESESESASPDNYLRYNTTDRTYHAKYTDNTGGVHKKSGLSYSVPTMISKS